MHKFDRTYLFQSGDKGWILFPWTNHALPVSQVQQA